MLSILLVCVSLKNKQPRSYQRWSWKDISKLVFLVTKASRLTTVCVDGSVSHVPWTLLDAGETAASTADKTSCPDTAYIWAGRRRGSKGGKQRISRKNNINVAWVPQEAGLGGWGTGMCWGERLVIITYSEQVSVRGGLWIVLSKPFRDPREGHFRKESMPGMFQEGLGVCTYWSIY